MSTFIDEAKIFVKSGKGGDGIVHFLREKFIPRGGPDGGDGGKGGDIILEVNPGMNTLFSLRHQKRYIAKNGAKGGTTKKTGRSAEDLVIQVPPGTLVVNDNTGEVIVDLTEFHERFVVCNGGRGGRGNTHFRNSRNQAPRIAEKGVPGESLNLRLELKIIADVGIIGVPNAGKSTFLAAVTDAKPKIASYPFTTLIPNLGVAALNSETTLILADIPGLIEGAHEGVGLGHDFLRHIQRTKVLIHLLDGLSEDPVADYIQIKSELALFDPDLGTKGEVVGFNKNDLTEVEERWDDVKESLEDIGVEATSISAVAGTGVQKLLYKAFELLSQVPDKTVVDTKPVYTIKEDPREFTVDKSETGWFVRGEAIERAADMTYWDHNQALRRFQRILESLGVDEALKNAGVQKGDSVFIGEHELEWED